MATTHIIEIKNMDYNPKEITIKAGDSIVWKNLDSMRHSATRNDFPNFDTKLISKNNQSEPIIFSEKSSIGAIEYFCSPHPYMIGTILIE